MTVVKGIVCETLEELDSLDARILDFLKDQAGTKASRWSDRNLRGSDDEYVCVVQLSRMNGALTDDEKLRVADLEVHISEGS